MTAHIQNKIHQELPEEMYRMLFENACDAIFLADMEGNFIAVNQAACDHVGYGMEELLRMRPEQISGRESSEKVPERLAQIRMTATTMRYLPCQPQTSLASGAIIVADTLARLLRNSRHPAAGERPGDVST